MADAHPPELVGLLNATDRAAREAAWDLFVKEYSRLLLHVARSIGRDYDGAMDGYTYLLEQLSIDDYRRLRAYAVDGRSKFTTWLVVVARRLCLDRARQRYGRTRSGDDEARDRRASRRRLEDLLTESVELTSLPDTTTPHPDAALLAADQSQRVAAALCRLEPRDQLLLKLRFEDDLSAREIAGVLGLATPFHVYRRLNALLTSLREALTQRRPQAPRPRPFNSTGEP